MQTELPGDKFYKTVCLVKVTYLVDSLKAGTKRNTKLTGFKNKATNNICSLISYLMCIQCRFHIIF